MLLGKWKIEENSEHKTNMAINTKICAFISIKQSKQSPQKLKMVWGDKTDFEWGKCKSQEQILLHKLYEIKLDTEFWAAEYWKLHKRFNDYWGDVTSWWCIV